MAVISESMLQMNLLNDVYSAVTKPGGFLEKTLHVQASLSKLCYPFPTTKTCQLISPLSHTLSSCIESLLQNIWRAEEVLTLLKRCVNKVSDVVTVFQRGTSFFS